MGRLSFHHVECNHPVVTFLIHIHTPIHVHIRYTYTIHNTRNTLPLSLDMYVCICICRGYGICRHNPSHLGTRLPRTCGGRHKMQRRKPVPPRPFLQSQCPQKPEGRSTSDHSQLGEVQDFGCFSPQFCGFVTSEVLEARGAHVRVHVCVCVCMCVCIVYTTSGWSGLRPERQRP